MRKKIRAEHLWWLGIVLWGAALAFWRPAPSVSYLNAPSKSPSPSDFGIFYSLVKRQAKGAVRFLDSASELTPEIGVLVLLSPRAPVSEPEREGMLEWVAAGGTLIVGHPVRGDDNERLTALETGARLSAWSALPEPEHKYLRYVPFNATNPRDVQPFDHSIGGILDDGDAVLLTDEDNRNQVTADVYGEGVVVQLASADLLDNRALGLKQAHLFAAALIDEVGRDRQWAFDEAYAGVELKPEFLKLIGSSNLRPFFLQILLLTLLVYWWRTRRMGRSRLLERTRDLRDVASQARDTGDFYRRAGKSRWALSCSVEYLKLAVRDRRATSEVKSRAEAVIQEAKQEIEKGDEDMERHFLLMRKIAARQRELSLSIKGNTR